MVTLQDRPRHLRVDIVAFDAEDRPVLVVEVKTRAELTGERERDALARLRRYVDAIPSAAFALLVAQDSMRVYDATEVRHENQPKEAARFPTVATLQEYHPGHTSLGESTPSESYIITLVEAWLRDVAYNWKRSDPPGFEKLREIGLVNALAGGTTRPEFAVPG